MANLNSTLGPISGTAGNLTFRQMHGKTVMSQRRSKSNKKPTFGMAIQQARFGMMSQVFQALNACGNGKAMTHAFPDRDSSISNFNEFMRRNLASPSVKAVAVTKQMNVDSFFVPAPYVVSRGSLTVPQAFINLYSSGKITLTGSLTLTTLGDLSTELVNNYGFSDMDVLTIFSMSWSTPTVSAKVVSYQMIVNTKSTDALPSFVSSAGVFTVGNATKTSIAVVRGRKSADGYMASNAQFSDEMISDTSYTTYVGAAAETAAAESYGYATDPYLQDTDPLH